MTIWVMFVAMAMVLAGLTLYFYFRHNNPPFTPPAYQSATPHYSASQQKTALLR